MAAKLANRFSLCLFSVQFDGEKPDKITRGACACNDDKVIFENPLNWTTRSFIFAKQREYENGPPTPEPSGETIVRGLATPNCPFVNLPETRRSRFGEELSAEKMMKAVWLRPEAVAQIEFLEWTEGEKTVSHYTRSSNTTGEVSDHTSLSSSLRPRI